MPYLTACGNLSGFGTSNRQDFAPKAAHRPRNGACSFRPDALKLGVGISMPSGWQCRFFSGDGCSHSDSVETDGIE